MLSKEIRIFTLQSDFRSKMSRFMYISVLSLLCLFCHVVSTQNALRASGTVAQQLRLLIDEETSIRTKLENRVNALKSEAIKLNRTIVTCTCPTSLPKKPVGPQLAYTGTLPAYTTSLSSSSTVLKYTNDLINVGAPFNVTSGHFRANVSGLYAFAMSVYMNPGYWTDMQLVKNGSPFLYARTGHYKSSSTNRQVNMATNFALVNLAAGDEVWPKYKSSSSTNIWADGVTTFTGVLLRIN